MTATAKDAAIAYAVMAGRRDGDAQSQMQPNVHAASFSETSDLSDVRIGVFKDHWKSASKEVIEACEKAVKHLESLGATVVDISIPHMHETHLAHSITILSEMVQDQEKFYSRVQEYSYESQVSMELGRSLSSRDFLAAQRVRQYSMKVFQDIFKKVDVIASPGTGITALRLERHVEVTGELNLVQMDALMRFIVHGNFIGIPAMVMPVGYDSNDLPIALQLQASHWNENTLLRLGKAVEGVFPNGIKKPNVYYSIIQEALKQK